MRFDEYAAQPRIIKQGFTKEVWGERTWEQFDAVWNASIKEDRKERDGEEYIKLVNSRDWWKAKALRAERALKDLGMRLNQYEVERDAEESQFVAP